MEKIHSEIFTNEGQEFEIAIFENDNEQIVRIFFNEKPIPNLSIVITEEVNDEMKTATPIDPNEELITRVKDWITDNFENLRLLKPFI
jgi:hypothetical protein